MHLLLFLCFSLKHTSFATVTMSSLRGKRRVPQTKEKMKTSTDETEQMDDGKRVKVDNAVKNVSVEVPEWMPPNWELTLNNIREMRKNLDAPVDTMGCDECSDKSAPPEIMRFHSLVSLMLSSQTKDNVTFEAMKRLKNHESGLTVDNVLDMTNEKLGELIYPVSFWKTKVKHIKETSAILKEKYKGDIPNTVELLCTLPGVGPKMAHLCMKSAWGIISGIGVDVHVHRISNRIGWLKKPTKTPEGTRVELESWLPKPLWEEVNHLLVGFGQQTCKANRPLCDTCVNLSNCTYGQKEMKGSKKKSKAS